QKTPAGGFFPPRRGSRFSFSSLSLGFTIRRPPPRGRRQRQTGLQRTGKLHNAPPPARGPALSPSPQLGVILPGVILASPAWPRRSGTPHAPRRLLRQFPRLPPSSASH